MLSDISQNLHTLNEMSGVDSILLAVDPLAQNNDFFLQGTSIGQAFWHNLRGGGAAGGKAFAAYSQQQSQPHPSLGQDTQVEGALSIRTNQSTRKTKSDLYELIRTSLRYLEVDISFLL